MEKKTAHTSDRKEAYKFASLINVCCGVDNVKVRVENDTEFYVDFDCEPTAENEVATLILTYALNGLIFYGNGEIERIISQG
ncbi:hypothetical protein J2W97_001229 [Paenibacillus jamilae]|nr:hypothetical protein [Paenibacillus jamilae]